MNKASKTHTHTLYETLTVFLMAWWVLACESLVVTSSSPSSLLSSRISTSMMMDWFLGLPVFPPIGVFVFSDAYRIREEERGFRSKVSPQIESRTDGQGVYSTYSGCGSRCAVFLLKSLQHHVSVCCVHAEISEHEALDVL